MAARRKTGSNTRSPLRDELGSDELASLARERAKAAKSVLGDRKPGASPALPPPASKSEFIEQEAQRRLGRTRQPTASSSRDERRLASGLTPEEQRQQSRMFGARAQVRSDLEGSGGSRLRESLEDRERQFRQQRMSERNLAYRLAPEQARRETELQLTQARGEAGLAESGVRSAFAERGQVVAGEERRKDIAARGEQELEQISAQTQSALDVMERKGEIDSSLAVQEQLNEYAMAVASGDVVGTEEYDKRFTDSLEGLKMESQLSLLAQQEASAANAFAVQYSQAEDDTERKALQETYEMAKDKIQQTRKNVLGGGQRRESSYGQSRTAEKDIQAGEMAFSTADYRRIEANASRMSVGELNDAAEDIRAQIAATNDAPERIMLQRKLDVVADVQRRRL